MFFIDTLYAHPAIEQNPYYYKFPFDPTLVFFCALVFYYLRGLRTYRHASKIAWWQKALFFSGVGIAVIALLPAFDELSDRLFFMHMTQHLLITMVAVPMMIFGIPFFVVMRGLPPWVFRKVYRPMMLSKVYQKVIKPVWMSPVFAVLIFNLNFWFWHIPKYYNLALLNDWYHLLEHATMAITALLLWRVIIDPRPMRSPLPMPLRFIYLAVIMGLNSILSWALTYSKSVWYAYDQIPMPAFWEKWGRLQDQQLGGLIMWVPGGLLMFIAASIVFAIWAARERRKDRYRMELLEAAEMAESMSLFEKAQIKTRGEGKPELTYG